MIFKRLSADKPDDIGLASKFICACPGYKLQTFGRLPAMDTEGETLLRGFPTECEPRDRLVFAAQTKAGGFWDLRKWHAPTRKAIWPISGC